jgi:hypothetical protein
MGKLHKVVTRYRKDEKIRREEEKKEGDQKK